MKLLLVRDAGGADFTFGKLYVNGVIECDTLEDRDRELEKAGCKAKVMAATAIPRGTYPVTVNVSARFKKRVPLLVDVPCFQGIRIHAGNTKDDTEGCILVGTARGAGKVLNSRVAFARLMEKIEAAYAREEEITMEVR